MLKLMKPRGRPWTACPTVSLDDCGGAVLLTLKDGNGHAFRQALDAHDAGKLISLCAGVGDEYVLCQGDLVAKLVTDDHEELHFAWHDERGGDGLVRLECSDEMVLGEALKSYCRMLMKEGPRDV